jgi:O-antigen/teichoic acid export membrane protein
VKERSDRSHRFVSAVAVTFGTYVAAATLSLLNLFIIARTLGPAGRGDIVFLITVATIAGHLGAVSLQEANANLAGTEPRSRPSLATNSLLLSFLLGAISAGVVAGLVGLFPAVGGEVERTLLWLALASLPLVILRLYLNLLAQADYHFAATNVAWLLGPATTVAANGLLALIGALSVRSALAAWIGGQTVGACLMLAHVHRHAGFGRPDLRLAHRSLRFGAKVHVGRTMAVGHFRIDQWFVGSMAGSRELGLYSVATAWAEVLSYLPGVIRVVQRPDLVRASRERAAKLAAKVVRATLLLTFPLSALFVLAAPFLCVTLLGSEFAGSVNDLRVLTLAAFGVVALELLGNALTAQGKPMFATAAVGVAFSLTVVLNAVLVPIYGGLGAAVAAAIATTAGGAAAAFIFSRALGSDLGELVPRGRDVPWLWRNLRARFSRASVSAEETKS